MATVKLDKIHMQYGDVSVLKNVELFIRDGEFLTLVGPSGCGKSTLLRIIAGLENQTSGHVIIDTDIIDRISPSDRNLSMVFQSYALYPHLTVFENIAVPLRMRWLSFWQRLPVLGRLIPGRGDLSRKIDQRVYEAAESMGLQELLERKPGQLSGGQRQRVAVGRALVRHPRAFLLDEPLSNLDAKLRVHMRTEITQLHRKLKSTFVYVTHDQAEAMTMSDRIAVMMGGELVQVGTPDEVYHDPQDQRVAEFIGSPKINILKSTLDNTGRVRLFCRNTDIVIAHRKYSGSVSVAVRPEKLFIADESQIDSFEVTVELIENLGSEMFIHGHTVDSGEKIVVKLPTHSNSSLHPEVGNKLWLGFEAENVLLFDQLGKRIPSDLIDSYAIEVVNG